MSKTMGKIKGSHCTHGPVLDSRSCGDLPYSEMRKLQYRLSRLQEACELRASLAAHNPPMGNRALNQIERALELENWLVGCKPRVRLALELYYGWGYNQSEVAQLMRRSVRAVSMWVNTGREYLLNSTTHQQ